MNISQEMATTPFLEDNDKDLNVTSLNVTTTTQYDAHGAMLFTVATVLVYGMSIVAFIAGHLRRRHHSKEEESQISKYLKRADDIRRQGVRDDVLKLRSQLLAGSVIVNKQNIERRKSRVERAKQYILNDINCVNSVTEDEKSPSLESLILPACTVPRPFADNSESSSTADVPGTPVPEVKIWLPNETEECGSGEEECADSQVEDSKLFIQQHGAGLARPSLHASLKQSLLDPDKSQSGNESDEGSPGDSPELNQSKMYRGRRRGVVLADPLVTFQGFDS